MNRFAPSVFFMLALAASSSSRASTIPASQSAPIPDVQVQDEASRSASLRSMLTQSGGGPVILLPIFTRCAASCPVLTRKLETALGGLNPAEPYRVVVFSFDPLETSESLRLYRLQQHVPADWKIVRSNEDEIRRFFGFFRYAVMNLDGKLVHPNAVFLLDRDLRWRWTLVGEDWPGAELASAIKLTRSPGFVGGMKANPERLAWIGFVTFILSVSVATVWMVVRKEPSGPYAG